MIQKYVGKLLDVPNATRWNSVFDAVCRLVAIIETTDSLRELNKACHDFEIPIFTQSKYYSCIGTKKLYKFVDW